ncbi:C-type lectin domain family 4 member G-like isoform X2 [Paralichthys olivaceus]|uniref:C-type lectin domain family 4 member G-like isoform X2 n=1 Tax=Paralichthys olivaceus TaxID=8255 RepID=UPI003752F4FB
MTEELHYATVVFKNSGPVPRENEESSIYTSIKRKVPATTVVTAGGGAGGAAGGEAGGAAGGAAGKGAAGKGAARKGAAGKGAAGKGAAGKGAAGKGACSQTFLLLACLGISLVLLMICIGAIIYICGAMEEQRAAAGEALRENQQLVMEKETLENKTEELTSVTEDLNRTLGVIMSFPEFPVNKFCPNKKCEPCQESWIPFQDHCYLFYDEPPRWKTWDEAQTYCQDMASDLAVVDSLREQEFITNHTKFYYDKIHGYWLGLRQNADDHWVWINGRNETEGFWMRTGESHGLCALTIPGHEATASWAPAKCAMWNKFICEHESLIRTSVS